eukprot:4055500-Pleurochrysis_carterae.AAC.3
MSPLTNLARVGALFSPKRQTRSSPVGARLLPISETGVASPSGSSRGFTALIRGGRADSKYVTVALHSPPPPRSSTQSETTASAPFQALLAGGSRHATRVIEMKLRAGGAEAAAAERRLRAAAPLGVGRRAAVRERGRARVVEGEEHVVSGDGADAAAVDGDEHGRRLRHASRRLAQHQRRTDEGCRRKRAVAKLALRIVWPEAMTVNLFGEAQSAN